MKVIAGTTFEFRNLPPGTYTLRACPDFSSLPDKELAKKLAKIYREIEVPVKNKQVVDVDLSFDPSKTSTVWGKTIDGLQLGLALDPSDGPNYHEGQTVRLKLLVRNLDKTPKKLASLSHVKGLGLAIHDAKGNPIPISLESVDIKAMKHQYTIPPHQTMELENIDLELNASSVISHHNPHVLLSSGKYRVFQTYSFCDDSEANFSGELTSGELNFVVVAKPSDKE